MKKIFLYLLLMLPFAFVARAQGNDPVQVSAQLLPPYSTTVSDYYSLEKLKLMLLNKDVTKPSITVRLRMTIESQSVKIRTREDQAANFQTFVLTNGSPYFVQPNELASYFNGDYLDFSGALSQQQYIETGKLPEGLYSFCFEAVEVNTGLVVSRKTCAFAWMTLSDPPLLNMPANNGIVPAIAPQNIIFNWTPRHTASPNAGFNVDYTLSLVEVPKAAEDFETISPQQAFLSYPAMFSENVKATSFLLDAKNVQLQEGNKYFWRVQAVTDNGIAAFRNEGFSEIFSFVFKNDCPEVDMNRITVQPYGMSARIDWGTNTRHLEYQIRYREKDIDDAEWFSLVTTNNTALLLDLKPQTSYQFQIAGACEYGKFVFVGISDFTTQDASVSIVPNCGDDSNIPETVNAANLLSTLVPSSSFQAGDFTINTLEVTGTGIFTGKGYTEVPWLGNMKVAVKFSNIKINTNNQLVSGLIETDYDPSASGIDDVDETLDAFIGGYQIGNVVTGVATADYPINGVVSSPGNFTVIPDNGYDPIKGMGGTVTIEIKDDNGNTIDPIIHTDTLPKTFIDKNGNIYQVGKDLTITKLGNAGGSNIIATMNKRNIDTDMGSVKFVHHPDEVYAFDEFREEYKKSSAFLKEYERIGEYYVSAKAIAPGKTDMLKAEITLTPNAKFKENEVQFINGKGTIYQSKDLGSGVFEIQIVGGPERDAQEIYAVYKDTKNNDKTLNFGKVLVASYPKRNYEIRLVPVKAQSNISVASIQQEFNAIYGKINISFTVNEENLFADNSWDINNNGLNVVGSSNLSELTSEMRALRDSYHKTFHGANSKTAVIFLLESAADSSTLGDMPRGQQYGFVFWGSNPNVAQTIAHEIGHGLFSLHHTFHYGSLTASDLSNNLLNYPSGEELNKHQWDFCHDPALAFGIFDSDGDSKSLQYPYLKCINDANEISQLGKIFLDVNGQPIILKADELPYAFFAEKEGSPFKGRLAGFLKNGGLYGYLRTKEYGQEIASNYYSRYNQQNSDEYYLTSYSNKNHALKVIVNTQDIYNGKKINTCNCQGFPTKEKEIYPKQYFEKPKDVDEKEKNATYISACEGDLYSTKNLGKYLANALQFRIAENEEIPSNNVSKLLTYSPSSANYIGYNYASTQFVKKIYYDELNRKLGFLKMSSGYEVYIDFVTAACMPSENSLNSLAQKVMTEAGFTNSKVIYIVYSLYEDKDGFYLSAGKAFGTDVSSDVKNIIASQVTTFNTADDVRQSIVNIYYSIPKSRIVYFNKIWDAPVGEANGKYMDCSYRIEFGSVGLAIDLEFYIFKNQNNNEYYTKILQSNTYGLKEESTLSSDVRHTYTEIVANKHSNWTNICHTVQIGTVATTSCISIEQCNFSFHKSCDRAHIDDLLFIASLVPIPGVQTFVLIVAVGYYIYVDEYDMALAYGIGLGFHVGVVSGAFKALFVGAVENSGKIALILGRSIGGQFKNNMVTLALKYDFYFKQEFKYIAQEVLTAESATGQATQIFVREVAEKAIGEYPNLITKYYYNASTNKQYILKYSVSSDSKTVFFKSMSETSISNDDAIALSNDNFAALGESVLQSTPKWLEELDLLLGAGTKIKINIWISRGLSESRIEDAFAKSINKAGLLSKLENSKSIYHQRVYLEDWDNIPGIVKDNFIQNGLTTGKTHAPWNNLALDLPALEASNFVNAIAVELPSGTKIYRVFGGNPAGGYWTIQKPNSIGEVIGGTAIQPAWNDFGKMCVYEVPQGQTLKVWLGSAAKQPISQGVINPHLPGGGQQIFIPDILRDITFKNLITQIELPW